MREGESAYFASSLLPSRVQRGYTDPVIHAYQGVLPKIHPTAFVEASAHLIGDVEMGEDASVWYYIGLRADNNATEGR